MLSRRNFLRGILGGLGIFLGKHVYASTASTAQLFVEQMRGLMSDEISASLVGRCCLATQAKVGTFSSEKIAEEILRDLNLGATDVRLVTNSRLRELISRQIRMDFERENVVSVDGWILSATEARIYMLMAIA